ncbi:hypothetical protein PTTG_29969 [Puccinia triticina 1-1 BBBD Race 1]|uniref:Uncharacterized protein n=1 Tax=Puccinia triticina (isolate 1-1 / race 1 (BBBD)) TaxID=630390 RepID=A0A180G169_PUCT1|nr:hypothetical protein PTTG_29969 [Puccinia triticina 1-1 BBBD Race 1]
MVLMLQIKAMVLVELEFQVLFSFPQPSFLESPLLVTQNPILAVHNPILAVRNPILAVRNPILAVRNPILAVRTLIHTWFRPLLGHQM